MRKINFLLVSLLVVASGFFTSCEKDDEASDADIQIVAQTGYISGNATVQPGTQFKVKWTATVTTSDMKYLSITRDGVALSGWNLKEIDSDYENAYNSEATLTAPLSGGPYTYAIVVSDKDENELASIEFVITLQAAAGSIGNYQGLVMGGGSTTYGSYLDAESGTVYKVTEINASTTAKNAVDIIFDLGKLNNSTTTALFASGTGTKFAATTITGTEFTNMDDDASFASLSATESSIAVATGDVVFFTTKAGKKGLIKVNSLSANTAAGILNIDLKIQQ